MEFYDILAGVIQLIMVTDPPRVQEADVLIVMVKAYDMEPALASTGRQKSVGGLSAASSIISADSTDEPFAVRRTSVTHIQVGGVLSIQNGVVKNEQLSQPVPARPGTIPRLARILAHKVPHRGSG